jgi:hypothetical protein
LLLHNPVLLPEDVALFAELVRMRNLEETVKPADYPKIAGRVVLFHEVIALGLKLLHETERAKSRRSGRADRKNTRRERAKKGLTM